MAYNEDDEKTDVDFNPEGGWDDESEEPTLPPDGEFGDDTEETVVLDKEAGGAREETELFGSKKAAHGFLVPVEGSHEGQSEPISDGTVVGREEGDIVLGDPKVSNPHAKFRLEDDTFILWDFGSKNGTFVNGEQIICATPLEDNDEIRFGNSVFYLKLLRPPKKATRKIAKRVASRKKKRKSKRA